MTLEENVFEIVLTGHCIVIKFMQSVSYRTTRIITNLTAATPYVKVNIKVNSV